MSQNETDRMYKNRSIIKEKREELYRLRSKRSNLVSSFNSLATLRDFAYQNNIKDFDCLRKTIDAEILSLQNISATLNNNPDIVNFEQLQQISGNTQTVQVDAEIQALETEIENLPKIFNLCPSCLGKKTVYDPDEAAGDPYARSSDYQKKCTTCDGIGTYPKLEASQV
jgi:hypothetical protein